jgi:hypothetical protein
MELMLQRQTRYSAGRRMVIWIHETEARIQVVVKYESSLEAEHACLRTSLDSTFLSWRVCNASADILGCKD